METRSNQVLVGAVTLALLLALAAFTVWLAKGTNARPQEFDIFFEQAVDGLNKGSAVTYSGVQVGQVSNITLDENDPERVRVRIEVAPTTRILVGTTASVRGLGFTGTSQVQLDYESPSSIGRPRQLLELTCPRHGTRAYRLACPNGVPTIPPRTGGLGAILNSAPQLMEKLSALTDRLNILLGDRNQGSIAGILANTNRLTDALADRGPEMAATIAEMRVAVQQVSQAADRIGALAGTTEQVVSDDVGPAMQNLNAALAQTRTTIATLNAAIDDARPGIQTFSQRTVPEANQLIQDLRRTAIALAAVAETVEQNGAGSLITTPRLPDYQPRQR